MSKSKNIKNEDVIGGKEEKEQYFNITQPIKQLAWKNNNFEEYFDIFK